MESGLLKMEIMGLKKKWMQKFLRNVESDFDGVGLMELER